MFKLPAKFYVALVIFTALILIGLRSFQAKSVLSKMPDTHALNQSTLVATAPAPPNLVSAVLGGKPIYVLYVTQSEDTILVRC
ncbi:hypothetical protein H6F93_10875 [Leptolyngbya sp. FACHB-671]|nr:hypothetical protein [Leptolyngbya sp. FACHB-671]